MSAAVQLLGTSPPAKSVLETLHFSGGTSGSCCTPESTAGELNFSSTNKGKVLGLAGAGRGAAAVAGFGLVPSPQSCLVLLLHLLKLSRNLSSKSLFSLEGVVSCRNTEAQVHWLTRVGVNYDPVTNQGTLIHGAFWWQVLCDRA